MKNPCDFVACDELEIRPGARVCAHHEIEDWLGGEYYDYSADELYGERDNNR